MTPNENLNAQESTTSSERRAIVDEFVGLAILGVLLALLVFITSAAGPF